MLKLEIGREIVIEEGREIRFGIDVEYVLQLEHSLATLSKWEAIWEKPFIDDRTKTPAEILSYIECMVQDPNPPEGYLDKLTQQNLTSIDKYINAKMTATWFSESGPAKKSSSEKITADLIYFWISGIPSPPPNYENWHLNKLFTYIKIHDVKNNNKKMNQRENLISRRELNERRKAELGTRG